MKAIYSFQQNARIEIYDVDMFLNPTTERFFVDVTVLPFENQDTSNIKPRIYQSAGYLYVETGVKNPISFEVFSSMGERIETLEIVESARIDLMNYKKGVYFIKSALNEDLLNAKFVSW